MASAPGSWRRDFPALAQRPHGRRLAYLDSASTTLKPAAVIDAVVWVFTEQAGNVGRGVHALAEAATEAFDDARAAVAGFLGGAPDEIVFTRGTTEAINLVAQAWGPTAVGAGDAIVVTALEHHANLVPWQELCRRTGATLRWYGITDEGRIDLDSLELTDAVNQLRAIGGSGVVVSPVTYIFEEMPERIARMKVWSGG